MGSAPFKSSRGRVKVALPAHERELLARLMDDVGDLLADSADTAADTAAEASSTSVGDPDWAALEAALSAPPPQDPAVARLLPDGHREDPDLAQGFRRLTEHGLRERKRGGLVLAASALRRPEPVVLDRPEAAALLKGLTDVRLVVAERLGLRTDEDAERLHEALQAAVRRGGFGRPAESVEPVETVEPVEPGGRPEPTEPDWIGAAAIYDALTWWQESLVSALR